jgi:glutamate synthase (NADPH) large chain
MIADTMNAIENKTGGEFRYAIQNANRSIGARLSGEIAWRHSNFGMVDASLRVRLQRAAGQSFGVWNAVGLHLSLEGNVNGYVGKGMAAGKLVIRPPERSKFKPQEALIIGATCLYGATGGKLFASGLAGERFAARNSGAIAVVEGIGDHGCEYMTGGVGVVLGSTGLNFGAGMTSGFALVLDEKNNFVDRYNHVLIEIHQIDPENIETHRNYLQDLLAEYIAETDSDWGRSILEDFSSYVNRFWLIKPTASKLGSLIDNLRHAA